MSIWKKALSAALSAALIASLAATSAFAVKGTTGQSDQTDYLNCSVAAVASLATCSQVADGISTVTLAGDATGAIGSSLFISASGATPIAATGRFTLSGSTITTPVLAAVLGAADTITFRAPSAPGTATVSVYTLASGTGIATLEGTLAITFTATSGLDVSATNSIVKTLTGCALNVAGDAFTGTAVTSGPAAPNLALDAHLCVFVQDGNGNAVNGATVSATITPVGLLAGAVTGQTTSLVTGASGVVDFGVLASGLPGTSAIATSATINSKTTTFAPVSFGFTGATASVTASAVHTVGAVGAAVIGGVSFVTKDSAGSKVASSGSTVVVTGTTLGATAIHEATATTAGTVDYLCGATPGTATIAVKSNGITSNAITVNCSLPADTFTVAFADKTVVPGGQTQINVTVKDAGGRPAPDGTAVSIVVSTGATLALTAGVTANGVASWTFLAPFNTGVATVLASVPTVLTTTNPQSASINIGAVVPVTATNASALGITKTGPFSTSTKTAALGKYVTFKMSFGTAAAGAHVAILVASKNSAGVWSSFAQKTSRVADASGNVYFYWRSTSAAWLAVRGSLNGMTNSVQARWR